MDVVNEFEVEGIINQWVKYCESWAGEGAMMQQEETEYSTH